jgi:hypothetical protein
MVLLHAVNMLHVPLEKKMQRLYYTAVDRAEALSGIDNAIRLVIQLAYRCERRSECRPARNSQLTSL